jgi:hypothetical protein
MKWIKTTGRAVLGLLIAGVLFSVWHETLGRFMFFEITDPPAADPHRAQHLRDAYLAVFGTLTVVMTLVSSIKNTLGHALVASTVSCLVLLVLCARGISQVFNPGCEDQYWGSRAILMALPLTIAIIFGIRRMTGATNKGLMKASQARYHEVSVRGKQDDL